MKATKKTLYLLSGALLVCIAATLLLTFAGRKEPETGGEATYFFTNYTSPDALMAASVENDSGSVIFASVDGTCYLSGEYEAPENPKTIGAFFEAAYRIPLVRMLEGASAADEQYGLTTPQATVMLEDVDQGGLIFKVGARTPDGTAYYTCLSGDQRVFLMESGRAELFLADIDRYYDLSLFPSLEDAGIGALQAVTVRRSGAVVYRLEQVAYPENGRIAYFALTEPFRLLIGADQFDRVLLTPLKTLQGTALVPEPETLTAYGLGDGADTLSLTYADGTDVTLRIGDRTDAGTYVLAEETGLIVTVPDTGLTFLEKNAEDLVGSRLLTLNLNTVAALTLNGRTFTLTGDAAELRVDVDGMAEMSAETFKTAVFDPLNAISIQGAYGEEEPRGACLLSAQVQTRLNGESICLEFYEIDSRRCAAVVNGQTAFWCSRTAVDDLLAGAAAPAEG